MSDPILLAPAPKAAVKRFTWDDVLAMSEAAMFAETERVELIGGEIVVMPEEGPLHVDALEALRDWLESALPHAL
ncbi:MAG: Uma2 family endonuclease, partial [Hyphomonadaceae bacterium]|nr:Uma2 family endonuclease [Hyphomonadaceae bacterium]